VYLVDIDHFKDVNDRFGHAAGDRLLTRFAELLREVFRDADHLVRWGGEEFLVVARHTSRAGACALAERLRARIDSEPFDLGDGRTLARSGSIGFACFPFLPGAPEAVAWERVIDLADHALYEAKQHGRNAWVGIVAEAAVGADFDVSIARDVTSLLAAPGVRVLRSVPDDRSRQVQTGPVPAVPDGQSTPG
jgi:diguanylate cyclase (GGDEF)-like protein